MSRSGGGRGWQAVRIGAAVCCVAALLCVAMGVVGNGGSGTPANWAAWQAATNTELLVWDPQYFEDEVPEDHNTWADRKGVNSLIRDSSVREATNVGRRVQDNDGVGRVLGQAAHVAFATIVELKRSMRGLEREELNMNVQSKISVAETMLQQAVKHLGITTVPPPPRDTRLSSLRSAMRLGRILRMMLARLPGGGDAHTFREARYNLAVYDMDQVSRQLSDVLLDLAESHEYEGLREPAFSNFDLAQRDADKGLEETKRIFGNEYEDDWAHVYKESRWNFIPRWQRREEERQEMSRYKGDQRISERGYRLTAHEIDKGLEKKGPLVPEKEVGEVNEPEPIEPEQEEDAGIPTEEDIAEGEQGPEDPVVEEAIEGAIAQDAKAEHQDKGKLEEMAERRIESTAVESAMEQAQHEHDRTKLAASRAGPQILAQSSGIATLNKVAAAEFHRAARQSSSDVKAGAKARVAAKAKVASPKAKMPAPKTALKAAARGIFQSLEQVTVPDADLSPAVGQDAASMESAGPAEDEGDRFDSASEPEGGFGGTSTAVLASADGQESKLPYNLELEKDAVFESVDAGMGMEVAHPEWKDSVEDATRIAVDAAIRAHEYTGAKGLEEVEQAAVEGATLAAKQMEEHADALGETEKAHALREIAQRVENSAVKSAILAADSVADEHTPHAHKAVLVRPLANAQPVAVMRPIAAAASAAAVSTPTVAEPGGAQFVPDTTQSVPGMVTGTVYMPAGASA